MSDEVNLNKHSFDNKTLTLVTTALVAASNLIPNDIWKKVFAALSPCATIAFAYVFKKCKNFIYLRIENKRAITAYNIIITDLKEKMEHCANKQEKARIKAEIEKYENDLYQIRIKNIKTFI